MLNSRCLLFYPLEGFRHATSRKAIRKSPIRSFTIPCDDVHTEQLRFISQKVLDLGQGSYAGTLHVTDANDAVYESKIRVRVQKELKFRRTEEWERDE